MRRLGPVFALLAQLFLAALMASSCAPAEASVSGNREPIADFSTIAELPPARDSKAGLFACGDVLLTRTVGKRVSQRGLDAVFAGMSDTIGKADLSFANLECPASYQGDPYYGKPENVTFRAQPGALFALRDAGFDVLSLANNHMNDYGPAAIAETLECLDMLGIAQVGAGMNAAQAAKAAIVEAKGIRFGFLAFAEPIWSVTAAGESSAGVAHALPEAVIAGVRALAASGTCDIVVVSVHWGEEFAFFPNGSQRDLAHAMVEAGADLVLGHHPHVLQGVERYRDSLIFYSLGNFVFDMAADVTYRSAYAIVEADLSGIVSARIRAVKIDRSSYFPSPATGKDAESILKDIADRSSPLGTVLLVKEGGLSLSLRE